MNLQIGKYVFQRRKRKPGNMLWIAGSKSKELRGSLANLPPEGVRANKDHPIQDRRRRLDQGRSGGAPDGEEGGSRRWPLPAVAVLAGGSEPGPTGSGSTRELHQSVEKLDANSPDVKTEAEAVQGSGAARRGGRRRTAHDDSVG